MPAIAREVESTLNRTPHSITRVILALALSAMFLPTLYAIDLGEDFTNLRARQYYLRIGLDTCDQERSVVRIVCTSDFILHDRDGKALFSGPANMPVRLSAKGAKAASPTLTHFQILKTFEPEQRTLAESYAKTASEMLKMKVWVRDDPNQIPSPSVMGPLRPTTPRLAVLLGPFASKGQAAALTSKISKDFDPTICRVAQYKEQGQIEAHDKEGKLLARATDYIGIRSNDPNGLTRVRTLRASYQPWAEKGAWLSSDNLLYRDMIELWISPSGYLSIINRVFLEHYLYGVVEPEIGNMAPFEMKKVQAVISRSEAIAKCRNHAHDDSHYDLCATQHCQVYRGILRETPATNAAVDATWGQTITYGNKVVDAVYSESCGGVTANSEDVWNGDAVPALRSRICKIGGTTPDLSTASAVEKFMNSRPDVACNSSQEDFPTYSRKENFRWVKHYSGDGLTQQMRRTYPTYKIDRIANISTTSRSPSGRVTSLKIDRSSGSPIYLKGEMNIRNTLGLKSTFFVLSREYDSKGRLSSLSIKGAGWGHGVGLCQVGATMMVKQGFDYIEVLKHYFHDVDIYRIYQ